MTEKTRESVAGIRVLKAYAMLDGDAADFERHSGEYFRRFMRYTLVDALFHPLILFLAGSCLAILLGVGGYRVIAGRTTVGTFVALVSYLGMLTWPMIAAGWMLALQQRATASMERINAFLGRPPQRGTSGAGPELADASLRLQDLTFSYPGAEAPALLAVSAAVPPGGSLGVVGEIGSGKSTLVQLLTRLQDPPPGTLFLGGRDVLELPLDRLRQTLAYVPQEAFLFSETIADNLRLGKPNATGEELEAACRTAALHDEILGFPNGYETLLGERGITLSGGQKQRLCLARALLKGAPVLLLDDTLSAVDAEAERRILAALGEARQGRTTVLVSHRVSAVRDLDQIVVLSRGRVVQRGTHAELAAAPGYYHEMVELQEMET
jgi:ATP-binding cassette, subfamily B, multidrug efflux pump